MVPEILSLLGVSQIKDTINTVRASVNPDLVVLGILLNKYNYSNFELNYSKYVNELKP